MAIKEFNTRIRHKRDTSANWESNNPVLLNGEKIIVDTTAGQLRMKTGDGIKTYTQLPFDDERIGLSTVAKTGSYNDLTNKPNVFTQSEADDVRETLRIVGILTSESNFKSEANFRAFRYGFDYLCVETFEDTINIDTTVDDGATVLSNFYDIDAHIINKTTTGTVTIQSTIFELDTIPYDALIYADYDGTGSVSLYFSKNGGSSWTELSNDVLTPINSLANKDVKIKIVINGVVRFKNIAWGCK